MATIKEAALAVMRQQARPMTFREVYEAIIEAESHEFNSQAAAHIVQVQIRRHCKGVVQKDSSPNKIFSLADEDRYIPLENSAAVLMQNSSIDQDLLEIFQRNRTDISQLFGDVHEESSPLALRTALVTTTKRLIDARLGQGKFRSDLEKIWNGQCAVTGCKTNAALRASHIKSWAISTNEERLDGNNGLLLIATLDALFDNFYISFSATGEMLISKQLPKEEILILGAHGHLRKKLNTQQSNYIAEHRAQFQIKEQKI